jgi:hypothetical protein
LAYGEEPIIAHAGEVIVSDSPTPTVRVFVPADALSADTPLVFIRRGKGIVFVRETTTIPMTRTVATSDTISEEIPIPGAFKVRNRECSRAEMYVSAGDTIAVLTDVDGSEVICWANKVTVFVGGVQ